MPLSGRQITTIVVAASAAAIFTPVSVMAASSVVSIADGSGKYKAKVGSTGSLQTDMPSNASRALGKVSVTNLPTTQKVSGAVTVANTSQNAIPVRVVAPDAQGTPFVNWIETDCCNHRLRAVVFVPTASGGIQVDQVVHSQPSSGIDTVDLGYLDVATGPDCAALDYTSENDYVTVARFYAVGPGSDNFTPARPLILAPPPAGKVRCLVVHTTQNLTPSLIISGATL